VTVKGDRRRNRRVTNKQGTFHILGLRPGTYTVRVELSGFKTEETTVA
jgi:hypothetical protein